MHFLSKIDALFDVEIRSVMTPLNINDEIKVALLKEENTLGDIIKLAKSLENLDWHLFEQIKTKPARGRYHE